MMVDAMGVDAMRVDAMRVDAMRVEWRGESMHGFVCPSAWSWVALRGSVQHPTGF